MEVARRPNGAMNEEGQCPDQFRLTQTDGKSKGCNYLDAGQIQFSIQIKKGKRNG